jgi:hypothetical protein
MAQGSTIDETRTDGVESVGIGARIDGGSASQKPDHL